MSNETMKNFKAVGWRILDGKMEWLRIHFKKESVEGVIEHSRKALKRKGFCCSNIYEVDSKGYSVGLVL